MREAGFGLAKLTNTANICLAILAMLTNFDLYKTHDRPRLQPRHDIVLQVENSGVALLLCPVVAANLPSAFAGNIGVSAKLASDRIPRCLEWICSANITSDI